MPRSIWKGVITFGMVSIPVQLFPATQDKDVSFHLLHQPDHSRIKFKRWCASEDREVEQGELVRAFEVSKDQYVEVTDEDLEQLPLPSRHTIELSAFVSAAEIDPIYYEKSYYLEPEETGVKPYALLMKVLEQKGVTGVASIALRNKESLCALRPQGGGILLETLHYPDEIREREDSLPSVSVNERELTVAGSLVDALAEPFDPSKYHDRYRQALLELIQDKTEGRAVVVPEGEAPGQVTDLMSALRASIEAARKRKGGPVEPTQREAAEPAPHEREGSAPKPRKASRARKKAA
ncbi:MAG: Ku protein [Chloroflexi bacterium]|nr:Ku protein [Chloroflexota bacterium]